MKPKAPLLSRVRTRIARKRGDVFLREDFEDLGGYDQVGRSLKALCAEGVLIRLGYGVYARAEQCEFTQRIVPIDGLTTVYQAIVRLGVEISPCRAVREYNAGVSTQVPHGRVIGVDRLIVRKLGYGKTVIRYERT